MLNFYKMLFFNTLMLSTLISISAYSWMSMWIGLEINLLSFIPLMKSHKNIYPVEAMLKYFISQVLASMILLFSIITSMNLTEFIPNSFNYWLMIILNSSLLMKLGMAPFHAWFPEVSEGLNWNMNLILMTWQKLAPMILIMYNLNFNYFFSLICIWSSIMGGILGLNQTSLRKILAYSSINHMGWMIASMMNLTMIWLIYFIIYSFIMLNMILYFKYLNMFYFYQLFMTLNKNKMLKILFIMNFLSLGGLPPFIGFVPKWLTINFLIYNNLYFLCLFLIISTLLTLYFYFRICLSILTIKFNESKLCLLNKINYLLILFNFINLFSIFICMNLFNIF